MNERKKKLDIDGLIRLKVSLIHNINNRGILLTEKTKYLEYLKEINTMTWKELDTTKSQRFKRLFENFFFFILSALALIAGGYIYIVYILLPLYFDSLETVGVIDRILIRFDLAFFIGLGVLLASFPVLGIYAYLGETRRLLRRPVHLTRDEKSIYDLYSENNKNIPGVMNPEKRKFNKRWIHNGKEISTSDENRISKTLKHWLARLLATDEFYGFEFAYFHPEMNFETFYSAITHTSFAVLFFLTGLIILFTFIGLGTLDYLLGNLSSNFVGNLGASIILLLGFLYLFRIIYREILYLGIYKVYAGYYRNRQEIIEYLKKQLFKKTNLLIKDNSAASADSNVLNKDAISTSESNIRLEVMNLRSLKDQIEKTPKIPISRYLKYMSYLALGSSIVSLFL